MKYEVVYSKYYTYYVDAESEEEAEAKAYGEFESEMRYPVADTSYDEVEVNEQE
jgi:hypothetical protein